MVSVIVDIGISSSYEFFFDIVDANVNRFECEQSPVNVMNAVMALWHMHEWYLNDTHPTASMAKDQYRQAIGDYRRNKLFTAMPHLIWLQDIAEATKHFRLDRSKRPEVQTLRTRDTMSFGFATGFSPLGSLQHRREISVIVNGASYKLALHDPQAAPAWPTMAR
jgi:hypothetical protein